MSFFIEVEYTKSGYIIAKIDGTGGYITRASLDHLKRNGTLSNVSNTNTTIKAEIDYLSNIISDNSWTFISFVFCLN